MGEFILSFYLGTWFDNFAENFVAPINPRMLVENLPPAFFNASARLLPVYYEELNYRNEKLRLLAKTTLNNLCMETLVLIKIHGNKPRQT